MMIEGEIFLSIDYRFGRVVDLSTAVCKKKRNASSFSSGTLQQRGSMVCDAWCAKKKKKIRPASVRVLLNNEEAWCANTCLFAVHLGSEMKFWSTNK